MLEGVLPGVEGSWMPAAMARIHNESQKSPVDGNPELQNPGLATRNPQPIPYNGS